MKSDKVAVWGRIVILLGFILLSASVLYSMRALTTSHTTQVPSRVPTLAFEPFSATAVNNFFGDLSCTWPCWQGITPGLTTSREAIQKLNVSPRVIELPPLMDQVDKLNMEWDTKGWDWKLDNGQSISVHVSWKDWVVDSISLSIYPNLHEMPLEKVINRFGPPEKFIFKVCPVDFSVLIPMCATLYYPKRGFEINLFWLEKNLEDAQIAPSDRIDNVLFFKPSTIQERLADQIIDDIQEADLHDWKGYGNFIKLYGRKP